MLTIKAPAKLNLTLEVLGKRPDGYHEIRSVLQSIALYDTLSFRPARQVAFKADLASWSAAESLVAKAVKLVQEAAGIANGVDIKIEKRIPLFSGLGGDSSDAAAVLRGLSELWKLNLPREKLIDLAARLGSDAAFFCYGGTALAEGRGEKITPLPSLPPMWAVLVVPDIPRAAGKTGRMYGALRPAHFTDGALTDNFVKGLKEGGDFDPARLFNTFENVAFELAPELKSLKERFIKLGVQDVHLAGSGPALFTLLEDKARAADLFTRLKNQGLDAYLAATL